VQTVEKYITTAKWISITLMERRSTTLPGMQTLRLVLRLLRKRLLSVKWFAPTVTDLEPGNALMGGIIETMENSMNTNLNYDPERKPEVKDKPIISGLSRRIQVQKQPRKTKHEVVQERVANNKMARYEAQEKKRAPKVQIDQKIVLWSWIIGIGIAFISSAIVSFNGITSVAYFVGLSADWMASLFFFFIELMYLLFLIAYLVLASRVDEDGKDEKTWGAIFGMITFGGIAVLANGFHTFDYWEWNWYEPRMWAGIILSISAPIAIISASKMASRVVFAKAIRL